MLHKVKGEITVFLSLVLVLILALVGTMIEAVRINVARVVVERSLNTAMDSAASQYSLPLFDEYHLILLDTGYDSNQANEEKMVNDILESMEYTFEPTKELSFLETSIPLSNRNLLKLNIEETNIINKINILDYDGTLFMNQAIQYEKYKDLSTMVEELLNKLKLLKSTKSSATVIKEKLKVDEKMMELDKYNMELMEAVEGIDFNKEGLQLVSSGTIKTKDDFVKMIVNTTPSATEVGINHNAVYSALSDKYINIQDLFNNIKKNLERISKIITEIKTLEENLKALQQARDSLNKVNKSRNSNTSKSNTNTKGNQSKTEESDEDSNNDDALNAINEQIQALEEAINKLKEEKGNLITSVNKDIIKVNNCKDNAKEKINEALKVIDKIEDKKPGILSSINDYKAQLDNNKEELATDYYNSLSEELKNTEDYFDSQNSTDGNKTNSTDIATMKELLEYNLSILNHNDLQKVEDTESMELINSVIENVSSLQKSYQSYHTKELKFDYSKLVLDSNVKNPVTNLSDIISNGVLELLVDDTRSLSDASLEGDSLYSQYANKKSTTDDSNNEESANNIQNSYENKSTEEVSSLYEDYETSSDVFSVLSGTTSSVLNELLFNQYMLRHFKSVKNINNEEENEDKLKSEGNNDESNNLNKNIISSSEDSKNLTNSTTNGNSSSTGTEDNTSIDSEYVKTLDSVLQYEQEYIIVGNKNDKENLKSIVNRLLAIRTILNFIYIMGDKEKVGEANTTALALVGFTGLAALVQFTKLLILLTWSYEESLVDVRGLLDGKSVPLLKTKETFQMKYQDLLCVNKAFIKKKANNISTKLSGLGFSYDDYISLFLLLTPDTKKSYRSMDLIQANINLRYRGGFALENCLYGFSVSTKCKMNSLFIKLPFVNNLINHNIENYKFEVQNKYTY